MEAQAAQDAIAALQVEPRGIVKLTCPVTLLHVHIGPMLARFMARYPDVAVQLEATNRRVDVVGEGLDVAIRVRPRPLKTVIWSCGCLLTGGTGCMPVRDWLSRWGHYTPRQS